MWFNLPLWIFTMRDTLFIANMILHALFVFLKEIQVFSFCVVILSGAIDYPSFLMLLKQLIPPLSTQLSDRRSSIVKQVSLVNICSIILLSFSEEYFSRNLLLFLFCYTIRIYLTLWVFFKLETFSLSCFYTQACHLLNILSKELLGDFEPCAELFIPVTACPIFYSPI